MASDDRGGIQVCAPNPDVDPAAARCWERAVVCITCTPWAAAALVPCSRCLYTKACVQLCPLTQLDQHCPLCCCELRPAVCSSVCVVLLENPLLAAKACAADNRENNFQHIESNGFIFGFVNCFPFS